MGFADGENIDECLLSPSKNKVIGVEIISNFLKNILFI